MKFIPEKKLFYSEWTDLEDILKITHKINNFSFQKKMEVHFIDWIKPIVTLDNKTFLKTFLHGRFRTNKKRDLKTGKG